MPNYNTLAPGLNHVGAYEVSGKPFATGSCVAPASGSAVGTTPPTQKISFPNVTRWIKIQVSGAHGDAAATQLRVGFSAEGLNDSTRADAAANAHDIGGNYFLANSSESPVLELKVSELHFMSNGLSDITFNVVAGLTSIAASSTTTTSGSSWSGSAGVG